VLEIDDGAAIRIESILRLIGECRLGIHDLSRVELDGNTNLPRFNMPPELGLFLGARRFGGPRQKRKSCVVLERDAHRYDMYCSDISGQEVRAHGGRVDRAIACVRNWLRNQASADKMLPAPRRIEERLTTFLDQCLGLCIERPGSAQPDLPGLLRARCSMARNQSARWIVT
jgi:hypothetical protein